MAESTQLDEQMTKNKESALYDLCIETDLPIQGNRVFLIDVGFLLGHKTMCGVPASVWAAYNYRIRRMCRCPE